ncbi:MAG: putative peptidoglycan-binding protein [Gemmatimonadetes bacterium]|nr:putative peptidoglycan-binding protein [Gemmatimonadota bacterium]
MSNDTAAVLKELVEELRTQNRMHTTECAEAPSTKDWWEKFANISTFLSSVVIASVGLVFTNCYNMRQADRDSDNRRQQLAVQQVEIVQKFMPQLTGSEDQKKLALIAISALGNSELATKLAALDRSSGSQQALEAIASSPDPHVRTLAQRALANFQKYAWVFSQVNGGSAVGRAALDAARKEAEAGAVEQGGDNRGPRVRKYLEAVGLKEGVGWSGAFVSWCFTQTRLTPPFRPSGALADIETELRAKGWLHAVGRGYVPQPGDIAFFSDPNRANQPRHAGIVVTASSDSMYTIEGNAGDPGDRSGVMVAIRPRRIAPGSLFGHIPD